MKKTIIYLLITIFIGAVAYYLFLPPINIHSEDFWIYLISLVIIFELCRLVGSFDYKGASYLQKDENNVINLNQLNFKSNFKKIDKFILTFVIGAIVIALVLNFILSPLFNAKVYSKRITVDEESKFIEDVEKVNFEAIPLLDKESSQKLGDRVMGQMPELVSQFYVSKLYTQINYNNDIIRVTPLEYDGLIKYFTNKKDGVKGYITVNSVTGESTLVKLDEGMKYMSSALFSHDLARKLRFTYPTKIFGEESFEIDNEGNPYWIVPVIKYVGIGLRRDIQGVVILDPITGDSKYYDVKDVPTWVDHVYSADIILEQVNDWGKYRQGFINSIFGQKSVVVTTEGYNYTVMKDDVYLYTGITSAASDESNIGFILTNMRTKETKLYSVPGAEEYSAMASARGQVQQMSYNASFPLLINLNNRPTYLISLKDNAGLVKMYAFVDVVDYQKVTVTDSSEGIVKAANNYLEAIGSETEEIKEYENKQIEVAAIYNSTVDGNTYYYIIDTEGKKYKASIKIETNKLPFILQGSIITIDYLKETEVTNIEKIS